MQLDTQDGARGPPAGEAAADNSSWFSCIMLGMFAQAFGSMAIFSGELLIATAWALCRGWLSRAALRAPGPAGKDLR